MLRLSIIASISGTAAGLATLGHGAFVHPLPTDSRGPCPGINTAANMGFLPRNGKNITQAVLIEGMHQAYNIRPDLLALFAEPIYHSDTDPTHPDGVLVAGNVLPDGTPFLDLDNIDIHNHIEHDASLVHCDADLCNGDDHTPQLTLINALMSRAVNGYLTIPVISQFFVDRFYQSIMTNPKFEFPARYFSGSLAESGVFWITMIDETGNVPVSRAFDFFWNERVPDGFVPQRANGTMDQFQALLGELQEARAAAAYFTSQQPSANLINGLLYLVEQRSFLEGFRLFETTSAAEFAEFCVECGPETLTARTYDGSCNNLANPAMGMRYVRFGRNVPLANAIAPSAERLITPNPRDIARKLLHRKAATTIPATSINLLAAAHVQFQVHDWLSHGPIDLSNPIIVPISKDDPLYPFQKEMIIGRTVKDHTNHNHSSSAPYTSRNYNTHWWDLSQIYGSDIETGMRLREHRGGRLKVDCETGLLPRGPNGIEITGFTDNWWVGLSIMSNIWVREHNNVADFLLTKNPTWDDERLFQVARLITTALNAKVHTVEWTTALLDNELLNIGLHVNWFGSLPNFIAQALPPSISAFVDQQQIIGQPPNFFKVNFTLSEEFTSVYRFHSLLPENLTVLNHTDGKPGRTYSLADLAFGASGKLQEEESFQDLLFTFGLSNPGALILNNYPTHLTDFAKPGVPVRLDLSTIDIVRDRERGVPRYKEFRELLNIQPAINSFSDITDDPEVAAQLAAAYNNTIEDVDLLIGCLAESPRPQGFAFGNTAFTIFLLMASRRLMTDRFLTDYFTPEVYTQDGLDWINNSTMIDIINRGFPEVAGTAGSVDNLFKPWVFNGPQVPRSFAELPSDAQVFGF